MLYFGGIDPAGTESKKSGCALITETLQVINLTQINKDSDILSFFLPYRKKLQYIGLDGICKLPAGLNICCFKQRKKVCSCKPMRTEKGRIAERELSRLGIPCFYTTKNSFVKNWVYRSLTLYKKLSEAGFRVLEIYPYGAKKRLFSNLNLSPKSSIRVRKTLQRELGRLGIKYPENQKRIYSDHELDALLGAYTCYLYSRGLAEEIGEETEGKIILPL